MQADMLAILSSKKGRSGGCTSKKECSNAFMAHFLTRMTASPWQACRPQRSASFRRCRSQFCSDEICRSGVIVKKSGTIIIKGIKDFKGIEGLKDSKLKHPPKHLVFSHIPGPFAIIDDTDHINVFRLIRTAIDKNGFLERTPDIAYSERYVFVGRFAVEGYCSWLSTCSTRTLVRGETDTHIVIHN